MLIQGYLVPAQPAAGLQVWEQLSGQPDSHVASASLAARDMHHQQDQQIRSDSYTLPVTLEPARPPSAAFQSQLQHPAASRPSLRVTLDLPLDAQQPGSSGNSSDMHRAGVAVAANKTLSETGPDIWALAQQPHQLVHAVEAEQDQEPSPEHSKASAPSNSSQASQGPDEAARTAVEPAEHLDHGTAMGLSSAAAVHVPEDEGQAAADSQAMHLRLPENTAGAAAAAHAAPHNPAFVEVSTPACLF